MSCKSEDDCYPTFNASENYKSNIFQNTTRKNTSQDSNDTTQSKSNILLSKEEKDALYPKILEHLNKLWKAGKSSAEYVKERISQDSEIDLILNSAWILTTEEKQRWVKNVVNLIFQFKYRSNLLCESLINLKKSSPKEFKEISDKIQEISVDFRSATGKELFKLHNEIEKDVKRLNIKTKELVSCKTFDDLSINPIELDRKIENKLAKNISQMNEFKTTFNENCSDKEESKNNFSEINKKKKELKDKKIGLVYEYLKKNLGNDINKIVNNEICKLKPIITLVEEYKLDKKDIRDTINSYIFNNFGFEYKDLIFDKFWPSPSKNALKKKPEFFQLVSEQWEKVYPNIEKLDSITNFGNKINLTKKDTLQKWMLQFFIKKFDEMGFSESDAIDLYKKYTKIKSSTGIIADSGFKRKLITWERIENVIVANNWRIETFKMNETKFNSIKGNRKNVKIPLICNAKNMHHFTRTVDEILYEDHRCPYCFVDYTDRLKKIGKNADPIVSLFTLCFFISTGGEKAARSEEHINPNTSEHIGTRHRIEVFLPKKELFEFLIKDKILVDERIPDCIEQIAIDFTLHIHPWLIDKIFKNYQKLNRFLIIVVYGTVLKQDLDNLNDDIQTESACEYPEHVKVVSLQQFAEFFGMDKYKNGFYYNELRSIEKLAESAINSDFDYNFLAVRHKKFHNLLKKVRETDDYKLLMDDLDRFI